MSKCSYTFEVGKLMIIEKANSLRITIKGIVIHTVPKALFLPSCDPNVPLGIGKLHDDDINYLSELAKVLLQPVLCRIVIEAADKDLSRLRVRFRVLDRVGDHGGNVYNLA